MSYRTRYNSRFSQYLTKCVSCARNTSKSFAKLHEGKCKSCVDPSALSTGPKCPDCGGPISTYNLSKGYHCNACTRAIEGPAYYSNEVSYENR
jgi:hypothetical protein